MSYVGSDTNMRKCVSVEEVTFVFCWRGTGVILGDNEQEMLLRLWTVFQLNYSNNIINNIIIINSSSSSSSNSNVAVASVVVVAVKCQVTPEFS
jgi:hypothetical protein